MAGGCVVSPPFRPSAGLSRASAGPQQGPECVQSFHISAETKVVAVSLQEKTIYVSVDSVTGMERIRAAALMWRRSVQVLQMTRLTARIRQSRRANLV